MLLLPNVFDVPITLIPDCDTINDPVTLVLPKDPELRFNVVRGMYPVDRSVPNPNGW
jgi:hypothetical protein